MKDGRPTRESDCYALGMVIYEVLSGRAPFFRCKTPVVIRKVIEDERPERPQGVQGVWFTDDLWGMLELCWKPQPNDRPGLKAILRCLEGAAPPSRPPSPSPTATEDIETGTDDPLDFTVTNPGAPLILHTTACQPSISHWNIVSFVGVYSAFVSLSSARSGPGRVRPTDVSPIDQLPHPDIAPSPLRLQTALTKDSEVLALYNPQNSCLTSLPSTSTSSLNATCSNCSEPSFALAILADNETTQRLPRMISPTFETPIRTRQHHQSPAQSPMLRRRGYCPRLFGI